MKNVTTVPCLPYTLRFNAIILNKHIKMQLNVNKDCVVLVYNLTTNANFTISLT